LSDLKDAETIAFQHSKQKNMVEFLHFFRSKIVPAIGEICVPQ